MIKYLIQCIISTIVERDEPPDSVECAVIIASSKDRKVSYQATPVEDTMSDADKVIHEFMISNDISLLYDRLRLIHNLNSNGQVFEMIKQEKFNRYGSQIQA